MTTPSNGPRRQGGPPGPHRLDHSPPISFGSAPSPWRFSGAAEPLHGTNKARPFGFAQGASRTPNGCQLQLYVTLREALVDVEGVRFVSPSEREEQVVSTGFEAKSIEAETVGGEDFRILDVPDIGVSEFTHFLDGAQRTWQILFHRLSPVYAAHTSAAILERIEGELQPPNEVNYRGDLEAFVPDNPRLADSLRPHLKIASVSVKDTHPGGLDEVVRQAISDRRDDLEKELAQRFAISPRHLSRSFKAATGTTVHSYMQRARINRAKALLRENSLSLKEIAHILGFSDASHLSAEFRRQVGYPPSEYRLRAEGEPTLDHAQAS